MHLAPVFYQCLVDALHNLSLHANVLFMAQSVEGFFAKLTKRRLKRGVLHSVLDLQTAINRFVA